LLLRSEGTPLGKAQINLAFRSLIRTLLLRSEGTPLGKAQINLAFRSLIRTFVTQLLIVCEGE